MPLIPAPRKQRDAKDMAKYSVSSWTAKAIQRKPV